jgi:hypothetical protein
MSMRALLAATRLSRRRLLKLRAPRAADMMLQSWLVFVVFVRFAANCAAAARELARGGDIVGPALAQFTLAHFVLVAFLLSFLSAALSLGAAGLDRRRLLLTGVRVRAEVGAEILALATWPMTAVIAAFLVPAAFVAVRLPRPGAAAAGLVLAFFSALLLGALLGVEVTLRRAWRRLGGGFRFVFVAALIGLVLSNFDFDWNAGEIRILVFQHPVLLRDASGAGLLGMLSGWGPWSWIVDGRWFPCAVLALVSLAACAAGAGRALVRAGAIDTSTETAPGRALRARGRRATLVSGELRRIAFSGVGAAAVVTGFGGATWLLATSQPVAGIPLLGGFLLLAAGVGTAANVFGADGGAVRRYALAGQPWHRIYMAKNAAWLAVMGAGCVPLLVGAALRLGAAQVLSILAVFVLGLVASVTWGNLGSLVLAAPVARMRAPREGPPFVNQAAPFALAAVVLGVHTMVAPFGSPGFTTMVFGLAVAAAILAVLYLRRVARAFDDEVEGLLEKLKA